VKWDEHPIVKVITFLSAFVGIPAGIVAVVIYFSGYNYWHELRQSWKASNSSVSTVASSPTSVQEIATPTSPVLTVSPEQTIRDYYSAIEEQRLGDAWQMLTEHFIETFIGCSTAGGYVNCKSYNDWWSSVKSIQIKELIVTELTNTTATAYVRIVYTQFDGTVIQDTKPHIGLIFRANTNSWLFDQKW